MGPGCFGWGGTWGFPWMIVFWAAIALCAFLMFRGFRRRWWSCCSDDRDGGQRETPLEILKKRYAKGEITREEFERMKKEIA
jgi:putative membrane protein